MTGHFSLITGIIVYFYKRRQGQAAARRQGVLTPVLQRKIQFAVAGDDQDASAFICLYHTVVGVGSLGTGSSSSSSYIQSSSNRSMLLDIFSPFFLSSS